MLTRRVRLARMALVLAGVGLGLVGPIGCGGNVAKPDGAVVDHDPEATAVRERMIHDLYGKKKSSDTLK